MSRNELAAIVAALAALAITIVGVVFISVTNSTHRLEACVESGGAYVNVPNTARMECERP
jgi:hypothetical protein